jgi:porphobilinogen deaminase
MDGLVATLNGKDMLRVNGSCKNTKEQAIQLGKVLAGAVLRRGGKKLLEQMKAAS